MTDNYINILVKNEWVFESNNIPVEKNKLFGLVGDKLRKTEGNLYSFINKYKLLTNKSDNVWFISIYEYLDQTNKKEGEFSWNDFEIESLEYADDEDEKDKIKRFWDNHLPFLFSVKNGYSYVAMVLDGVNKGKVVYGREPEYEDIEIVSNSFGDFQEMHVSYIENKGETTFLSDFI